MTTQRNFLLGYGERLVEAISVRGGGAEKKFPRSFDAAREWLAPQVTAAVAALNNLPAEACPRDEAVAILTLHPQFLAKSYHPAALLREVNLEVVGSRPKLVKPEKWTRKGPTKEAPSTELFVAGTRAAFRSWADELPQWSPLAEAVRQDLSKVELFRAPEATDTVQRIDSKEKELFLEIGLHVARQEGGRYILEAFKGYAESLDIELFEEKRLITGHLCFMPAHGARDRVGELSKFAYLRVVREMPRLRRLGSVLRVAVRRPFPADLPDEDPVDPSLRIAVLDGGTPKAAGLDRWVTPYDAKGVGEAVDEYEEHGACVNSALLFGPLSTEKASRPYAAVDHFRVLDADSGVDEHLYDVMHRVRDIIRSSNHSFFNLSIGPAFPTDDTDVHPWTSMLDDLLSEGTRLVTVAAGNGGELDAELQHNRVQVPADGVNGLAVGAVDSREDSWKRASYSSVGPGRSPGVVKPDVVFFGGCDTSPFFVVDPRKPTHALATGGTSFASPSVLRLASGIRSHFGDRLGALAIRALLIHCAEDERDDRLQHGWGRVPEELEPYVVCEDGSARIIFQGEISPGEWLRIPIPVPTEAMSGMITVRATFCYATRTDGNHPGSYTQSGLVVTFRPNDSVFDKNAEDPLHPKPQSFFQLKQYGSERELRRDAHKWETVLHRERRFRGRSLRSPCFDVNFQARQEGHAFSSSDKMRYALAITVTAPRVKDLYNRIVRRYQNQLRPLEPVIQIPIRATR